MKYRLFYLLCIAWSVPAISSAQTHLWFPGQLAAHMQQYQKQASKQRCTNVDYPGHFNSPCDTAYFRRLSDTHIETVVTSHRLPTLFANKGEWLVSLDKKTWLQPETDDLYRDKDKQPDTSFETTVALQPRQIILLRNARQTENDGLGLGCQGTAIIDFHELELGTVSLSAQGTGILEFYVGESVEEASSDNPKDYEQYPLEPIRLTGSSQDIQLPARALRYLRVRSSGNCTLSQIRFNTQMWPVEQTMEFRCSNDSINQLFDAAVKTLHTSMHNFNLDGVKRDFLPWAMDAVISSMGTNYVFGSRQMARGDISIALMPPHPTKDDLGVVDYPLHALIGLKAYMDRYGDDGTPEMFRSRIEQQMNFYMELQDTDGFISADSTTWGFIPGWAMQNGPLRYGKAAYPQMMLYENFRIAARLERKWKNRQLEKQYSQRAEQLKASILSQFWDEERHGFINGYTTDGSKDLRLSQHTQYWAVLTDLFPKELQGELYTKTIPSLPEYTENVSYENGYNAIAYIKAGQVKQLKDFLMEVWYKWLEQGNTRFPENFMPKASTSEQLAFYGRPYGLSLCHGANGVPPVIFVLQGILGFRQSDKGYTLCPNLLDMEWAKGRIPTKDGYIDIELERGKAPVIRPSNPAMSVRLIKGL